MNKEYGSFIHAERRGGKKRGSSGLFWEWAQQAIFEIAVMA
jgi:hypothetical protein